MASRKPIKGHKRAASLRKPAPAKLKIIAELDSDPVRDQKAPAPSPVESAMLELIDASEETEKLVHQLAMRLVPVLKADDREDGVHGHTGQTGIPLVDTLHSRYDHIKTINSQLLDLLDRLAT